MSKFVLLDARVFAGAADLSGNSNMVELSSEIEAKDTTAFGDDWRTFLGGLAATSIHGAGQWEAGSAAKVDNESWGKLNGRTIHPWTICPANATDGDLAWLTQALRTSYKALGQVGEVAPWDAQASGTTPLLRGTVLNPPGTARTATGDGTEQELVGVTADQKVYAGLHVLSASGTSPSLTVKIQSDSATGMASATDQITFTAATGATSEWKSKAGAITDTFWRASWTISGTSPSFLFIVSIGIG